MRNLTLLTISALLVLSLSQAEFNKDLFVGNRECGDFLREQRVVAYDFINDRRQIKVEVFDGVFRITYIQVIDLWHKEAESAEPKILTGGPGFTHASIQFTSKYGKGIHFLVRVFAKNDTSIEEE